MTLVFSYKIAQSYLLYLLGHMDLLSQAGDLTVQRSKSNVKKNCTESFSPKPPSFTISSSKFAYVTIMDNETGRLEYTDSYKVR